MNNVQYIYFKETCTNHPRPRSARFPKTKVNKFHRFRTIYTRIDSNPYRLLPDSMCQSIVPTTNCEQVQRKRRTWANVIHQNKNICNEICYFLKKIVLGTWTKQLTIRPLGIKCKASNSASITSSQWQNSVFQNVTSIGPFVHQIQFCDNTNSAQTSTDIKYIT